MTFNKKCFVVSPMSTPDSKVRRHADYLLDHVIRPALEPLGYEVARADNLNAAFITPAMLNALATANLVVAVLAGLNANVLYEMGIANGYCKPVVPIADTSVVLPFNVQDQNAARHSELPDPPMLPRENLEALIKDLALRAQAGEPSMKLSPFAPILQSFGQKYSLKAVYFGKTWILNSFRALLNDAEGSMNRDYEIIEERNPAGLKGIAKLIAEAGTPFLSQCRALHQTVQVARLPEPQKSECLDICRQIQEVGDATMRLVDRIAKKQTLDESDIADTKRRLEEIFRRVDECHMKTSGQDSD